MNFDQIIAANYTPIEICHAKIAQIEASIHDTVNDVENYVMRRGYDAS